MARLQLVSAGAPELVRADQKDRFYSSQVASLVSDITHNLLPLRYVLRWEREFHLLAELWYYGLTTVIGNQTLGEEYCNIVQVAPGPSHKPPSAPRVIRRTTAILVQIIGPYMLEKVLGWLGQRVEERNLSAKFSQRHYEMIEIGLEIAGEVISTAHLIHLALFYLNGLFHQLGKRITSIKYLAVRYGNGVGAESQRKEVYRLLGWFVLAQLALKVAIWLRKLHHLLIKTRSREECNITRENGNRRSQRQRESERLDGLKCPLCLEGCRDVTTTQCGHLFCWNCVTEWVSNERKCPVCRTPMEPQKLVFLQHFAP